MNLRQIRLAEGVPADVLEATLHYQFDPSIGLGHGPDYEGATFDADAGVLSDWDGYQVERFMPIVLPSR